MQYIVVYFKDTYLCTNKYLVVRVPKYGYIKYPTVSMYPVPSYVISKVVMRDDSNASDSAK